MFASCQVNDCQLTIGGRMRGCWVNNLNRIGVRVVVCVLAAVAVLMPESLVYAQVAGATLSGSVTDPSGGVLTKAKISITNTATGIGRTAAWDSGSLYVPPNLFTGQYRLEAAAPAFVVS